MASEHARVLLIAGTCLLAIALAAGTFDSANAPAPSADERADVPSGGPGPDVEQPASGVGTLCVPAPATPLAALGLLGAFTVGGAVALRRFGRFESRRSRPRFCRAGVDLVPLRYGP